MAEAVVDTDVLVDHLRGHRALPAGSLAYSVISRCELFAGRDAPAVLNRLLGSLEEVDLDRRIAELAGNLKRRYALALADAVVAATARELSLPLVTRNTRHFRVVTGLRTQDPSGLSRGVTLPPR